MNILVDTGAAATVLAKEVWDKAKTSEAQLASPEQKTRLVGVQGSPLQLCGAAEVCLELGGETFPTKVIVANSLTTDVILGRDFLKAQQCTIELGETRDVLHFKERGIAVAIDGKSEVSHVNIVL